MAERSKLRGLYGPVGGLGRIKFNKATGGTMATFTSTGQADTISGALYQVHSFTSNGTFAISVANFPFDVLVVAGGGGGGTSGDAPAGPGGAGGLLYRAAKTLSVGSIGITIGGAGGSRANGGNSVFSDLTSLGGGYGGWWAGGGWDVAAPAVGGSGGGGSAKIAGYWNGGASGTSGQGNRGGDSDGSTPGGSGGAGGAGSLGTGGAGVSNGINGTATTYAPGNYNSSLSNYGAGAAWGTPTNAVQGIVIIRYRIG